MTRRIAFLIGAALAVLAGCTTTQPQGTLAELASVKPDVEEVYLEDGLERAAESYRRYLEETSESARTPEAMRRLARRFGETPPEPGHLLLDPLCRRDHLLAERCRPVSVRIALEERCTECRLGRRKTAGDRGVIDAERTRRGGQRSPAMEREHRP